MQTSSYLPFVESRKSALDDLWLDDLWNGSIVYIYRKNGFISISKLFRFNNFFHVINFWVLDQNFRLQCFAAAPNSTPLHLLSLPYPLPPHRSKPSPVYSVSLRAILGNYETENFILQLGYKTEGGRE